VWIDASPQSGWQVASSPLWNLPEIALCAKRFINQQANLLPGIFPSTCGLAANDN
jgi:hypothetical protein